jgi:hypothetical protein
MFSRVLVFGFTVCVQLLYDNETFEECACVVSSRANVGIILTCVHHTLFVYTMIGSFCFGAYALHMKTIMVYLVAHLLCGCSCPLTTLTNRLCGMHPKRRFRTLMNKFTRRRYRIQVYYMLLVGLMLYDCFKICTNSSNIKKSIPSESYGSI